MLRYTGLYCEDIQVYIVKIYKFILKKHPENGIILISKYILGGDALQYVSEIIYSGGLDENLYLNKIPAVKHLISKGSLKLSSNITLLVGENGSGKSTLLEAIAVACGFNPEGGTVNFSFSTKDSHSQLSNHLDIAKRAYFKDGYFLRAESFYNAATYIDEVFSKERELGENTPYGLNSLHEQSHGESFLSLIEKRFSGKGLYILDEPEAALSPARLLELIVKIDSLLKADSQFIIATHSPILMAFPSAEVLLLNEEGITPIDYKETEHFKITKQFLDNPERMLKYLIEE